MPTYDYHCSNCDRHIEIFHSMKDAPQTLCPSCDHHTLKRQISQGSAVIFKGTGFYETDYKRTPPPQETAKPNTNKHSCGSGPCASCTT